MIAIITVLAGILLPVASSVMTNARKAEAKNTEEQVVAAVKNFYTDYSTYPMPTDSPTNQDVCFGSQKPTVAQLLDILRADNQGDEATINTHRVVYIELPQAKNQTAGQSKDGLGADGMLYDPWGTIFLIGVDGDYNGTVNNP